VADILRQLLHDDGRAYLDFAEARANGAEEVIAQCTGKSYQCSHLDHGGVLSGAGTRFRGGETLQAISSFLICSLRGEFFLAAVQGAYHIARANLCLIPDDPSKGRPQVKYKDKIRRMQNCCQDAYDAVQEELRLRIRLGGKRQAALQSEILVQSSLAGDTGGLPQRSALVRPVFFAEPSSNSENAWSGPLSTVSRLHLPILLSGRMFTRILPVSLFLSLRRFSAKSRMHFGYRAHSSSSPFRLTAATVSPGSILKASWSMMGPLSTP